MSQQVLVNGKPLSSQPGWSVVDLLKELDIPARGVAVEINGSIVSAEQFAQRKIEPGDQVEIVTFVGGG